MNYLMVMPRFTQEINGNYIFPVGIAYVSSNLKKSGRSVFNLNLNLHEGAIEKIIIDKINDNEIDVLCVGGLSPHFNQIFDILKYAKRCKPSIKTVVGGGLITASPKAVMSGLEHADIGVMNEGEYTIIDIADSLENNTSLSEINGIVYQSDNEYVITSRREDIEDLDSLPYPDYDGFGFDPSINTVTLCTSRSCPYRCTFCFHTCGTKYRSRSLESIFAEIDWLVTKYNAKSIGILDELFSIDNEKLGQFCNRIKPYNIQWSCQMRVDNVNFETLKLLKESGCTDVSFGIESADNRILKSMRKNITIEKVERAITLARKAKINPFGNLLFGDKDDDMESFETNLKWFISHPELNIGFIRTLVLPGTSLYKHAIERGIIKDEVAYHKEGYFTINITKLVDDDYYKCLSIMDGAVINKEFLAKNIIPKKFRPEINRTEVDCECPLCDRKLTFRLFDFFGLESFNCHACGQNMNVNLFYIYENVIIEKLKTLTKSQQILVWGMGTVGKKFAIAISKYDDINIRFTDKNPQIQNTQIGRFSIDPPHAIAGEFGYILFGTSLLGKVGEAISNSTVISRIQEDIKKLGLTYTKALEIDSFLLSLINSGNFNNQ